MLDRFLPSGGQDHQSEVQMLQERIPQQEEQTHRSGGASVTNHRTDLPGQLAHPDFRDPLAFRLRLGRPINILDRILRRGYKPPTPLLNQVNVLWQTIYLVWFITTYTSYLVRGGASEITSSFNK